MSAAADGLPEMLGRLKLTAVRDRLDTLLDGSEHCSIGANFRGVHGIAPCRTDWFDVGVVAPGCVGRGWRLRRAELRRSPRHVRR